MIYDVNLKVMPLKELLDPQGKAVMQGLSQIGISGVEDVRIGKLIQLKIEANSTEEALEKASDAASKLLHNQVMEYFVTEIV